eukprot:scaffold6582_cov83-Skeletonema_dohrnii-CCMP3373.AAC.1
MWRGHQAVQSSVQRWLLRGWRQQTSVVTNYHHQFSSARFLGGVASSYVATDKLLLQKPSILSAGVGLPSLVRYGDVRTNNSSNPLLISSSAFSTRGYHGRRGPDFRGLQSVDEIIVTAYEHLDDMSRRDVSAFWSCISKLMTKRQPRQQQSTPSAVGELSFEDIEHMLYTIFDDTTDGIEDCGAREITETTLGMAKIIKILRQQGNRRGEDSSRIILRRLLLSNDMKSNEKLFQFFAGASMGKLDQFDARGLSNLAYAYALIDYVPEFDDGSDLFDHITMNAVEIGAEFNAQDISNMMWAFATVNKSHVVLFEAIGDQVVAFEHLGEFRPQALSNTVWAYATANVPHPKLFEKVANHIVESNRLDRYIPQDLSIIAWAYSTAGVHHPKLFEKVANHIVQSKSLDRFNPQNLSNIVWAYATAAMHHPKLFEKMANHIVDADSLDRFNPQDLSNTVWAYATAGISHPNLFEKVANHIVESDKMDQFNSQDLSIIVWACSTAQFPHPKLFKKVADVAIRSKRELNSHDVANLLWSYATMGVVDKQLFATCVSTAAKLFDSYTNQGLANIAWAYAVADVDAPLLFNAHFVKKCVEKEDGFEIENLRQLYQWHLWQSKEMSNPGLPIDLQERCYDKFISEEPSVSKFQDNVVAQLPHIGLDPKEEVLVGSGYRIDALVEVNGKAIGIEVDGPSHFIGRSKSPLAKTILKRRQVPSIDGIELVSVPYWEWDKLGKDQAKKQDYLRKLLSLTTDNS